MHGDDWEVRRADAGEANEVAELWLSSRRGAVPPIPPPIHSDDDVRSWFLEVVLPRGDTWVLDGDTGIVGLLVLADGRVDQLYVKPDWNGDGVGSKLLDFAKAARPNGLGLWTFRANTRARRCALGPRVGPQLASGRLKSAKRLRG